MEGAVAVARFDQTICELIKRRNALQHIRKSREKKLADMEEQMAQLEQETGMIMATPSGDSTEAKSMRQLENRLDKVVLKNHQAKRVKKTYQIVIEKLQAVRTHCILTKRRDFLPH